MRRNVNMQFLLACLKLPAGAPFGGYKQSGIGRETHKVILEHYTQMKNIIVNLSDKPSGFYDLD